MAKRKKRVAEKIKTSLGDNKRKQIKQENKILRNILIGIGVFVIGILAIIFIYNSSNSFNYKGVDFEVVKFCDAGPPCLTTYRTSLPVKVEGDNVRVVRPSEKTNDYNFYLRSDPRVLNVDFEGSVKFAGNMVFNTESDFVCDGYGAIAGANFIQLFTVLKTKVVKDENATCDPEERYVFITVKEGDKTRIEEYSPSCYDIYIKGCEVLDGTEKFMIEALIKVNEAIRE